MLSTVNGRSGWLKAGPALLLLLFDDDVDSVDIGAAAAVGARNAFESIALGDEFLTFELRSATNQDVVERMALEVPAVVDMTGDRPIVRIRLNQHVAELLRNNPELDINQARIRFDTCDNDDDQGETCASDP